MPPEAPAPAAPSSPSGNGGSIAARILSTPAPANASADPAPAADGGEPKPEPNVGEFSQRFASLTKKEEAARKAREELKAEREALSREKGEWTSVSQIKEAAKQKPAAVLEFLGVSFDDLANAMIDAKNEKPKLTADERLDELQKQLEREKEEQLQRSQQMEIEEEKAHIETYIKGIDSYVAADPEKWELIAQNKAQKLVWEVTEAHWEQQVAQNISQPVLLDLEEACKRVEDYLEEELAGAVRGSKRLSSKLGTIATEPAQKQQQQGRQPNSITNHQTAAQPGAAPEDEPWDDAKSREKALAILREKRR